MQNDRIERSWTVRFEGIGPVVVNNVDRDSRNEAIRQAKKIIRRSYPDLGELDSDVSATYTEIHLGPIIVKDEERKRS